MGKDAIRVRTIVQRQKGGWVSLTGTMPGAPVSISAGTTALSLISSLRPSEVSVQALIGTIIPGSDPAGAQDVFLDAGTTVPQAEFVAVRGLVITALSLDTDPFDVVQRSGNAFVLKQGVVGMRSPQIHTLNPSAASVGSRVLILGENFSSTPAENLVVFTPAATADVLSASSGGLTVRVPPGAASGLVTAGRTGLTATASFTLIPPVSGGLDPAS
ncbi:hypothetical protein D3C87_1544060 [compost metagenome]